MTEEEKNAAAAYIKLQLDVRQLILDTVLKELNDNPHSEFSLRVGQFVRSYVVDPELRAQMNNYRIVYKGSTASMY